MSDLYDALNTHTAQVERGGTLSLGNLIALQALLQIEKMGGDPRLLDGEARADFIRWNAYALEDEIHEATAEVQWKPWARDQGRIDTDKFNKELVDALHFFMNLLLAGNPGKSIQEIADLITIGYLEKNLVNAKRQEKGYTGIKCPECHREVEHARVVGEDPANKTKYYKCPCSKVYHIQEED